MMLTRLLLSCVLIAASVEATTFQDLQFIAGHWRCTSADEQIEEFWSEPEQGSIIGMYRDMKGGETIHYEIMTIEQSAEGLVLLVNHFEPGLKGWEEKSKPVTFHIKDFVPSEVVFESGDTANLLLLTYSRTSKNTMDVLVERLRNGEWLKRLYHYARAK